MDEVPEDRAGTHAARGGVHRLDRLLLGQRVEERAQRRVLIGREPFGELLLPSARLGTPEHPRHLGIARHRRGHAERDGAVDRVGRAAAEKLRVVEECAGRERSVVPADHPQEIRVARAVANEAVATVAAPGDVDEATAPAALGRVGWFGRHDERDAGRRGKAGREGASVERE